MGPGGEQRVPDGHEKRRVHDRKQLFHKEQDIKTCYKQCSLASPASKHNKHG